MYHGVFYFLLSLLIWSSWCFNFFLRFLRLYMCCWKFEPLIMLNEAQPTLFHLFLTMFFLSCTYVFYFISSSIFVSLVRPITLFYNFLLPSPNFRFLLKPLDHSLIQSCSNTRNPVAISSHTIKVQKIHKNLAIIAYEAYFFLFITLQCPINPRIQMKETRHPLHTISL